MRATRHTYSTLLDFVTLTVCEISDFRRDNGEMYNLLDAVRRTLAAGYQSTHSNIPEGL
jgi:hypothetical protein